MTKSEEYNNLDLMEKGTRYDHYVELREAFATGVEIIKNLSSQDVAMDAKRKLLEGAIEAINGRLNALSKYYSEMVYNSKLRREVESAHTLPKKLLMETNYASQEVPTDQRPSPEVNP